MARVAIINYGMGNLDSVARAVEYCGGIPLIANRKEDLSLAAHIILPGVGAFGEGIRNLKKAGFEEVLRKEVLENKIPLLGICLGMQLFGTTGNEGGRIEGLNFIEGEIIKLTPQKIQEHLPHIGWNEVNFVKESPLFGGMPSGKDFYFIHSYCFYPKNPAVAIARTSYCGEFISVIQKENIFGVQFHPEKSQKAGFQMLKNFLNFNA